MTAMQPWKNILLTCADMGKI